ncbi:helix-turn-helix domain-containing protein [Roseivirga misakiensis]|uniref:Transcriptional regulator n=1 Tax=Roseivirga misakiensis TaxID=1563681 RepID=A0A1E5SL96_9BACT|nr:AraC family transcriptional regulator [Roseivirga misakiensis]OEJ99897.1 transcriptional regulator [Roseivirga misakiensis]
MAEVFETFKPKNTMLQALVDYYYLDIKSENETHQFQCFPHFNNTISLYSSHKHLENGDVMFDKTAEELQIFTPIREKVLHVRQLGEVHRIVIVFHPLGIQQFYRQLSFKKILNNYEFFKKQELTRLFSTTNINTLTDLLDSFLVKRYIKFEHNILEKSLQYVFTNFESFSVNYLSEYLNISRQHLNRIFKSYLGVSVKKFQEIVLFRKTMNKRLFENSEENFTSLAYEFNFNDQSHLNKTYKNLTNNSPKAFFHKGTVLGRQDTFWHLIKS